jgi:hypothetical protein
MRTILFVAYGGGHVNMIIPLLQRLEGQADLQCVTLGLTTAAARLESHGLQCTGFASLLAAGDEAAMVHGEWLASRLPASEPVSRDESIAYLGLSYADLEAREGEERAAQLYNEKGRQAFLPIGPIRRLFDRVKPDLVVTTISPRAEQAALMVARERAIPSICLVDLFARPSLRRASEAGYGSRVCVISESVRQWLIDAGRQQDEVVVAGNPAFDRLGDPGMVERALELRHARGWENRKVILWASQVEPVRNPFTGVPGDPGLPQRIEQQLLEIVARHPEWHLVIRPHPNEPAREALVQQRAEISGREDSLDTLLQAVDAVVIMTSTVGLEARLLRKPLVSVDLSVFSQDTPYVEMGLSRGVRDLGQLETAVQAALAHDAGLPEGFPSPGGATDAVLAQIELLLAEGAR